MWRPPDLTSFDDAQQQEMNNVERVTYYGDLPQEAPAIMPNDPPAEWPQQGHLKFNNVQLRYRDGLPLVLKGVTFEAMPGEKVGVDPFNEQEMAVDVCVFGRSVLSDVLELASPV